MTEINIIERDPSLGTYTILYNLYTSLNTASESQSGTHKAKVNPKPLWKSSAIEEKTLEEEYIETTEVPSIPRNQLIQYFIT